ncbi:MAG: hypothetical protein WBE76_02075 [Terracidiphilus sp.]
MRKIERVLSAAMFVLAPLMAHAATAASTPTLICEPRIGSTITVTPSGFALTTTPPSSAKGATATSIMTVVLPVNATYVAFEDAAAEGVVFSVCAISETVKTASGPLKAEISMNNALISSLTLVAGEAPLPAGGMNASGALVQVSFKFQTLNYSLMPE